MTPGSRRPGNLATRAHSRHLIVTYAIQQQDGSHICDCHPAMIAPNSHRRDAASRGNADPLAARRRCVRVGVCALG